MYLDFILDDKDSVQDCMSLNSMITNKFTEKPTKNVETSTLKPHVKGSDKYSASNITDACSRTSAIGYFVIDWIVFGGIIFLFVYVFMRCKGNLLTLPRLKIYTFCGKYVLFK